MITKAAEEVGKRVGAKFLVAFTLSGDSARRLARLRSTIPVLAFTPSERPAAPSPSTGESSRSWCRWWGTPTT